MPLKVAFVNHSKLSPIVVICHLFNSVLSVLDAEAPFAIFTLLPIVVRLEQYWNIASVLVVFGQLNPSGSPERLEQLQNISPVSVAFGQLNPSGSPERLEQF